MSSDSPWTPLHARVHQTLRQRHLLPRGDRLLVAVSGGQDSLCLAQLLLDLQPKWEWTLAIAHCDHRWRNDSSANAAHVERLARGWNLPFYLETAIEIPQSEADARQWRYRVLTDLARDRHDDILVTGHTQTDLAETLLYNLTRGSGADGLQALNWRRSLAESSLQLVRPLLNVSRATTGQFCRDRNLPIWEDDTNQDVAYRRNRIRWELIPYLKQHFNPNIDRAIAHTAELLRADVECLERSATEVRQRATRDDPHRLDRRCLQQVPLALQRRALRQFLSLHLPQAPQFEHIEKFVRLVGAPNRSRTDPFPGGAIAEVSGDWILWHSQSD